MKKKVKAFVLISAIVFFTSGVRAQFLIPGEGILGIKLNVDSDEIEWELGFSGERFNYEDSEEEIKTIAKEAGISYDMAVHFNHIMWLPVTDLLFEDNELCFVQISSYAEYNEILCTDIGTLEGLNFWDGGAKVRQIYGEVQEIGIGNRQILIFPAKGIGVELSGNQVRAMFIFQPK
jgi:hypothetical protein